MYEKAGLRFASLILNELPTVITFNYDCILERLIEIVAEDYYSIPWDRAFSYGIQFKSGGIQSNHWITQWKYRGNFLKKYNPLHIDILKLHGSRNWLHRVPLQKRFNSNIYKYKYLRSRKENLYLDNADHEYTPLPVPRHFELKMKNGIILNHFGSTIVAPVKNKEQMINQYPFLKSLWDKALQKLIDADRIVVIGLSLSPTDQHIINLLKSSANLRKKPLELELINPDQSVYPKFQSIFEAPILWATDSLESYVQKYFNKEIHTHLKKNTKEKTHTTDFYHISRCYKKIFEIENSIPLY